MGSSWWSRLMAHGSTIQIREPTWSTWWTPFDGISFNGRINITSGQQPSFDVYFTVLRVSDTQFRLQTVNGTYVYMAPISLTDLNPFVSCTSDITNPSTIFTMEPVPGRNYSIYMKASNGLYVSGSGIGLWTWSLTASSWERHDILEVMQVPSIRGTNVGSWLITERWMVPTYYARLKPWNDGTGVYIQSMNTSMWLTLNTVTQQLLCNVPNSPNSNETFFILRTKNVSGEFQFKSVNFNLWSMVNGSNSLIFADAPKNGTAGLENFNLVFQSNTSTIVLILAPNGKYLRVWPNGNLTADVDPTSLDLSQTATWTSSSAFNLTKIQETPGEWQLSYEFGPEEANRTFTSHHDSFFNETDWILLAADGVNAVRIPIGWWIKDEPNQEFPFVPQYSRYLDWAFQMALKYNIRIWISIHGAGGSQSGWGNTAGRSGMIEFVLSDNINKTLDLLRWLCVRYVSNPNFLGVGFVNEPVAWGVPKSILQKYYSDAYDLVRSYSQCLFMSMEARIGSNEWGDTYWLMYDAMHTNLILEVHQYDVFSNLAGYTVDQEIAFVENERLDSIMGLQSRPGRTVLVGEFSNAMYAAATPDEQKRWSLAQVRTLANATNGWFFWSLRLARGGYDHWSWYKSRANGWLPKNPETGTWY